MPIAWIIPHINTHLAVIRDSNVATSHLPTVETQPAVRYVAVLLEATITPMFPPKADNCGVFKSRIYGKSRINGIGHKTSTSICSLAGSVCHKSIGQWLYKLKEAALIEGDKLTKVECSRREADDDDSEAAREKRRIRDDETAKCFGGGQTADPRRKRMTYTA